MLMPKGSSPRPYKYGTGRWQVGQLVLPGGTIVPQIMQKSVGEGAPLETAPIPRADDELVEAEPDADSVGAGRPNLKGRRKKNSTPSQTTNAMSTGIERMG